MAINNKTLSDVQALTSALTTTENNFRTGINDISTQVDNNDTRIDNITDGTHTYTGRIAGQAGFGSYSIISGQTLITVSSGLNVYYHSGTGTVTVPTASIPNGAIVRILSEGTMTVDWGTNARGISLGSSCEIADGTFANGRWFFTESLYK